MKTTLNAIRKYSPCTDGWEKLLSYLGKTKADDEPLSLLTILDSNGLRDVLWCLRAVEGYDRELRLFAVWCARQVQHLLTDQRSLDALDVAEQYALGKATEAELTAARDAAWEAIRDAADAAGEAAAWAAGSAAWSSATWAAWSSAEAARNAARDAAEAADMASAREAAWNAADAVWSAASAAAWVEMGQRQEAELRRICEEG